jgi:hypothetical protein
VKLVALDRNSAINHKVVELIHLIDIEPIQGFVFDDLMPASPDFMGGYSGSILSGLLKSWFCRSDIKIA